MPRTRTSGIGRPKGTPNKLTSDIKAMILGALQDAGGRDYLARQAEQNPAAFMGLIGKVLPLQVSGTDGGPVMVITGVVREAEDTPPTDQPLITHQPEDEEFSL